ncbi:N-acetylmuramidase domain-containing protein [Arenibacter certesii]|uniref:Peptidoglycan-binding protein n=1 Tax=Arenibacter certesii TaxID=228955 RepID=A0A918IXP4_9FLAO|nr:N-acetylmuramidase family protein [Arenibacter certesii]GGW37048.1 peptidoglycan-binding protein [Arenibacter certesii]
MKTLKYRSRGPEVFLLEEVLNILGYEVYVSQFFGRDTHLAILEFQKENELVVDGMVGLKTWAKLVEKKNLFTNFNSKLLSEQDLQDFADHYGLELPAVKAVNSVESRGKGFLVDGRAVILFEGHVFWRELKKRGLNAQDFYNDKTKEVLYEKWTRKYYKGGSGEYSRLQKAIEISDLPEVADAAYSSASWGAFQIMGYHYENLGYASINEFVLKMQEHEREQLVAFGKFISLNRFRGKTLTNWLKEKNWANFAHGYNGPGYKQNKYDAKLRAAYERYRNQ